MLAVNLSIGYFKVKALFWFHVIAANNEFQDNSLILCDLPLMVGKRSLLLLQPAPSAEGHVELTPEICSEPLIFQILCLGEQKVLVSSGEIFLKSGCLWDRVFNECRSQCLCRQAWNTPLQRIPSETPFQIFFYSDTHAVNLPCTLIV